MLHGKIYEIGAGGLKLHYIALHWLGRPEILYYASKSGEVHHFLIAIVCLIKVFAFLLVYFPSSWWQLNSKSHINIWKLSKHSHPLFPAPVVVKIRDAILVFNIQWLKGHLEPNRHFAF